MLKIIKTFLLQRKGFVLLTLLMVFIFYIESLTPSLIEKQQNRLLHDTKIINNAIKQTMPYENLEALRLDYSNFTPRVTHWSNYGSAVLSYLGIGWRLGMFSIHLPQHEVIIDQDGSYQTTRKCGSTESTCVTIPPDNREFFVMGKVYYATLETYDPILAHNMSGYWKNPNNSSIKFIDNCFIASTQDMLDNQLTIEPLLKHGVGTEFQNQYGYYIVEKILFHAESFTSSSYRRVSKKEFFQSSCQSIDNFK